MLALGVEEGRIVRYVLFDRGSVADEYVSVPEYYGPSAPGDVVGLSANPTVVSRLTGADPERVREVARTGGSPERPAACRRALRRARCPARGRIERVITLYDADRCPYCARARIALAEKGVAYETVAIDLSDRPAWLYEKNPLGKAPVLEEDTWCLPESAVIMEYLEERYPDPQLLPADGAARALARLAVWRSDDRFGDYYYAARRERTGREPF